MAYFVTVRYVSKDRSDRGGPYTFETNQILLKTHPVKWAAKPDAKWTAYLLFWAEIADELALDAEVASWCQVED